MRIEESSPQARSGGVVAADARGQMRRGGSCPSKYFFFLGCPSKYIKWQELAWAGDAVETGPSNGLADRPSHNQLCQLLAQRSEQTALGVKIHSNSGSNSKPICGN